jgi:cytochrome P450
MQAVENGKIIPTLVTTKEKNEHAALKRPIASAFNMSSMMKYEPFVDDTIVTLVKKLNEKFVVEDLPCEIHKWIQYCAVPRRLICWLV